MHTRSVVKPPSLSVRFPSRQAPPWAAVRAHTTARHFPKRSQSSWHLCVLSPPSPPACSTNIPEGQRAARASAARLSTCLIGVRGDRNRSGLDTPSCAPSCLCNLQCLFDRVPWRTQELLNVVKGAARFKQGYLNLNPVTGR